MSALCEQLVTLASNGLSQSTDISPEAATSAVSTLVEENAHLQEDIESMTQQLEQVCFRISYFKAAYGLAEGQLRNVEDFILVSFQKLRPPKKLGREKFMQYVET